MKWFNPGAVLSVRDVLELEAPRDVRVMGRITFVNKYGVNPPNLIEFVIEDADNEMTVILPPSAWIWSVYVVCGNKVVVAGRVVPNDIVGQAIADTVWPEYATDILSRGFTEAKEDGLCRLFAPIVVQ